MSGTAQSGEFKKKCSRVATAAKLVSILIAFTFISRDAVAESKVGRSTASASCHVSVTIPALTGIDLSAPAVAPASSAGARIAVRLFQTGAGAIVIRTAPYERDSNAIHTVALKNEAPASQIVAATTRGGWLTFDEPLPKQRAQRTSNTPRPEEVTYEVWRF